MHDAMWIVVRWLARASGLATSRKSSLCVTQADGDGCEDGKGAKLIVHRLMAATDTISFYNIE